MKNQRKSINVLLIVFLTLFLFSCDDKNNGSEKLEIPYDSNKPVELIKFYPDSGVYKEKVLLDGKNFGTDIEKIRVYFNNKKAAVIGSTGTRIYVQAPRLPGDTCTITVVVGKDSLSYTKPFYYFTSVSVSTIAGNGQYEYQDGDLSTAMLSPRYLCVDKEDNIFVSSRNSQVEPQKLSAAAFARIDQETNQLITIESGIYGNVPTADPITGVVTFPTETTVGSIYTLDPKEFWGPRKRELLWPDDYPNRPAQGYKHAMSVNPSDGFIYMRYYHGDIIKFNPRTYEVELVYKTAVGDNFGLTFIPQEPNILYLSFYANAGVNANSICSIDVTNPATTFKKLSGSTSGGFRDGPLEVAQFRSPNQIMSDAEGNIYVADAGNHCIRRITPDKMVETVLGVPGKSGYKDGGKDEALFNYPTGIGVGTDGSVYVGDIGNRRVRKLSIN
jgi:hypothetical protein